MPLFGANACDTVRAATSNDLGTLADELVDLTEEVGRSTDTPAQALLDEATASYERAEAGVDGARHTEDFAAVTAEIGRGRYQLSAVRARLNHTSTSEQQQPCFFDPAHGPPNGSSPGPERDLVVTREELRDRWLFGSPVDDDDDFE